MLGGEAAGSPAGAASRDEWSARVSPAHRNSCPATAFLHSNSPRPARTWLWFTACRAAPPGRAGKTRQLTQQVEKSSAALSGYCHSSILEWTRSRVSRMAGQSAEPPAGARPALVRKAVRRTTLHCCSGDCLFLIFHVFKIERLNFSSPLDAKRSTFRINQV